LKYYGRGFFGSASWRVYLGPSCAFYEKHRTGLGAFLRGQAQGF